MAELSHVTNAARLPAEERRRQIILIAIDLFSQKGFSGTTTKEIAQAAGVTEAIIFRHFATKEALYNAIIDFRVNAAEAEQWFAEFEGYMERNEDQRLFYRLIEALIFATRENAKFERLMMYAGLEGHEMARLYHERFALPFVDKLRDYIARRQREGALLSTSPDLIISAAVGMAKIYGQHKYLCGSKNSTTTDESAIEAFTHILMNGVCAPSKEPVTGKNPQ